MNANELADSLYKIESVLDLVPLRDDCATMLRQQQAEIKHLKELFGCDPAYFEPDTHPVKELTDEVKDALMDALSGWKYIRECHGDLYGVGWDRVQDKLEAILRKAQEK